MKLNSEKEYEVKLTGVIDFSNFSQLVSGRARTWAPDLLPPNLELCFVVFLWECEEFPVVQSCCKRERGACGDVWFIQKPYHHQNASPLC